MALSKLDNYFAKGLANTNGKGLWTKDVVNKIKVKLQLDYFEYHGELIVHLRVVFKLNQWDTRNNGLIYTDLQFERDIKTTLHCAGFKNANDICYSEQGMQGLNYVDFDVGHKLSEELRAKG